MKTERYVHFDTGISYNGFAVLEIKYPDNADAHGEILETGVDVFQPAIQQSKDENSKVSKANGRGISRRTRRLTERKCRSHTRLLNYFKYLKFIHSSLTKNDISALGNPLEIRSRSLDNKITLSELFYILYTFVSRRGYKSNRVSGEDTNGAVKKALDATESRFNLNEYRTLGEMLYNDYINKNKTRSQYQSRGSEGEKFGYLNEFHEILNKQKTYHPELTENIIQELEHIIFDQRPLKIKYGSISKCEFFSELFVIPKYFFEFQEFRVWEYLNNLKYFQNGRYESLNNTQKEKLFNISKTKEVKDFNIIRYELGLSDSATFNYEHKSIWQLLPTQSSYIDINKIFKKENQVDKFKEIFDDRVDLKNKFFYYMEMKSESDFRSLMKKEEYLFSDEIINKILKLNLESGRSKYSLKAFNILLKKYRENNSVSKNLNQLLTEPEIIQKLKLDIHKNKVSDPFPDAKNNPVVHRSACSLVKRHKLLEKQYGKLIVSIGVSDDKLFKSQKKIIEDNEHNRKFNNYATRMLNNHCKISNLTDSDIKKFKLFYELKISENENDINFMDPFTAKTYSLIELYSESKINVAHLIPSTSGISKVENLTLCEHSENIKMSNTHPSEYYSDFRKQEIINRCNNLPNFPFKKINQIINYDTSYNFISRDLNNNYHIIKLFKKYFTDLGIKILQTSEYEISGLSKCWGLYSILGGNTKDDIRDKPQNHALDSIVGCILAASYKTREKIFEESRKKNGKPLKDMNFHMIPFPNGITYNIIKNQLCNKTNINVKQNHKISGELHNQDPYGKIFYQYKNENEVLYVKKYPFRDIIKDIKKIEKIIDPILKKIILVSLENFKNYSDKLSKEEFSLDYIKTKIGSNPTSIRLSVDVSDESILFVKKDNNTGNPSQFYHKGNNIKMEINRNTNKSRAIPLIDALHDIRLSNSKNNISSLFKNDVIINNNGDRSIINSFSNSVQTIKGKLYINESIEIKDEKTQTKLKTSIKNLKKRGWTLR